MHGGLSGQASSHPLQDMGGRHLALALRKELSRVGTILAPLFRCPWEKGPADPGTFSNGPG